MAKIILNNKPTISTKDVSTLLDKATNKDEIAKLIIEKNTEYGSNKVVNDNKILFSSTYEAGSIFMILF